MGKSEQILSKAVMRVLGVARGDRSRIMEVLEREEEKDIYNCCSEKTRSQLDVPIVLGQGQVRWLQSKKLDWSPGVCFLSDRKHYLKLWAQIL